MALHIELASTRRRRGGGYPVSLLGTIAFVRQGFLDAQYRQLETQRYEKMKTGVTRPMNEPALDALQPRSTAASRRVPRGPRARDPRALGMAKEFKLDPMITGAPKRTRSSQTSRRRTRA